MPTPTLAPVDLRRQAFRELLSALKEVSPNLIMVIVRALPNDPPAPDTDGGLQWYADRELQPLDASLHGAVTRLKEIPDFLRWAEYAHYEWRVDEPDRNLNLSLVPVPVIPSMPLDRADLQRPILACPGDEDETEEHFMAWALAHYRARRAAIAENQRVASKPQMRRDAAWFVRSRVLGCPMSVIDGDRPKYVSEKVNEFAELLRAPDRRPGRPSVKK